MKTCPNPKCKATGIPDEAQFCPEYGNPFIEEHANNQEINSPNSIEQIDTPQEEAGALAIIVSILFPLIGIIIFFVRRKAVKKPMVYLWGAFAGYVVRSLIIIAANAA